MKNEILKKAITLYGENTQVFEEWADAFCGHLVSQKYSIPSTPIERRQIHSDEWFQAKNKSCKAFLEIYARQKQGVNNERD